MAALASSAVAFYPATLVSASVPRAASYYSSGKEQRNIVTRSYKITSLAQGDLTDTIGAAAFGLSVILGAGALWDDTNSKGYPTVVVPTLPATSSSAGDAGSGVIVLLDGSAAPAPVKVTTTTAYITVTGIVGAPTA